MTAVRVLVGTAKGAFVLTLMHEDIKDVVDYIRTSWGNHAP